MGTIFDDKEARDLHLLATFINGIKLMGREHSATAVDKLNEFITSNSVVPCDPGYTRDSNGVCQKDPLPPDPTHQ